MAASGQEVLGANLFSPFAVRQIASVADAVGIRGRARHGTGQEERQKELVAGERSLFSAPCRDSIGAPFGYYPAAKAVLLICAPALFCLGRSPLTPQLLLLLCPVS